MLRFVRPLTAYVLTTIAYLLAVALERGPGSAAAAMTGHVLAIVTVVIAIHKRKHRHRQMGLGPPFTRSRAWRAFKLFYCIAVPPLVYLAVTTYINSQPNPYLSMDASGDVAAQMKDAREMMALFQEESRPVVQSMWLGLPLVAVELFYAIRAAVAYIIGRSEAPSVHSRAA